MALAMRGEADRAEFIRYTESLDVPSSWRDGPLRISLGGTPAEPAQPTVKVVPKVRGYLANRTARVAATPVVKVSAKDRVLKKKKGVAAKPVRVRAAKPARATVDGE